MKQSNAQVQQCEKHPGFCLQSNKSGHKAGGVVLEVIEVRFISILSQTCDCTRVVTAKKFSVFSVILHPGRKECLVRKKNRATSTRPTALSSLCNLGLKVTVVFSAGGIKNLTPAPRGLFFLPSTPLST